MGHWYHFLKHHVKCIVPKGKYMECQHCHIEMPVDSEYYRAFHEDRREKDIIVCPACYIIRMKFAQARRK